MPLCEGRPDGACVSCPENRNDATVRLSQGDLMLCPACEKFRFPDLYSKPVATEATKAEPSCVSDTSKRQIILNDVLCFINNKFHNHPATILKLSLIHI